uniref:Stabilization protein n=1 Tax=Geladintestivirus 5 TaxID=3233137 RepID=A0AAU8MHA3_9CAUD
MGNIITKLNLNRTPNLVENNSLVFAKNIRIDVDGTIHKDYSINPMSIVQGSNTAKMYDNILIRIIADFNTIIDSSNSDETLKECTIYFLDKIKTVVNYKDNYTKNYKTGSFRIIDIIPNSNEFYLFIDGIYTTQVEGSDADVHQENMIIRFDEETNLFYPCDCNWTYSGGNIDGCVINNLLGEKIINIGESNSSNLVPLKCINLAKSHYTDDESIYTQSPNIPITNLGFGGIFSFTIPNGVYQFFVRYKIRDGFYTDWFPASKELFAGNKNKTITNYGTLEYVNTHLDSDKSFIFAVNHLYIQYSKNYESFQIGFILSHDDAIYARAWKHFDFIQSTIKFDYRAYDAEEIEVTDLTRSTFALYNVGNITSFKNKLYVSNYVETNFNENLQDTANHIAIGLAEVGASPGYSSYQVHTETFGFKQYISAFKLSDKEDFTDIGGKNGIIDKMLNDNTKSPTPRNIIEDSINTSQSNTDSKTSYLYDLMLKVDRKPLGVAQMANTSYLKNVYKTDFVNVKYEDNSVVEISINSVVFDNIDQAINKILNTVKYLDENATFVDANRQTVDSFTISIYRKAKLSYYSYVPKPIDPLAPDLPVDRDDLLKPSTKPGTSIEPLQKELITREIYYAQDVTIKLYGRIDKLNKENTDDIINYTTLIPYQKYKFYIHYVKRNGEITNGYYCGGPNAGIITVPYKEKCDSVIYPKFSNIIIPDKYCACFFSILHYAINTATIFNVKEAKNAENTKIAFEGSCIEMNTRLIPFSKNIEIHQDNKILIGDYYHSSDSSIVRYFGANGIVYIDKDLNVDTTNNKCLYAISDYESTQEKDATLIKCTPYIKNEILIDIESKKEIKSSYTDVSFSYTNHVDLNLLGYICQVSDTDRETSIAYYSDGSNAYYKQNLYTMNTSGDEVNVNFYELSKYTDSNHRISQFRLKTTNKTNIYSNYNLNFLGLSEDPKQVVKTYYGYSSDNTNASNNLTYYVLWRLLTSLTLSDIYKLPSMYKQYNRKTYTPYNPEEFIIFDNTVRSSILEGDEARISIFKFDAEDYYNVPTNRGKIVNLVSIGDAILVHTHDSMFKFTGNNSLQSNAGEIQSTETEVFKTGVSEVFGSDFGFAGLQDKHDHIITENGYIFFDRDSRIVYMYSGQGQITKLSDSVERLFRHNNILNIYFANDYYNNRFFMCIWFSDQYTTYPITLSFCVNENVKTFVSTHDFCFNKAFNTKTKCYFLTMNKQDICTIDKNRIGEYHKLEIDHDKYKYFYPYKQEVQIRSVLKNEDLTLSNINIPVFYSIIDIIENLNYETIKTLDYLIWCSRYVENEFPIYSDNDEINMAESKDNVYPCSYLQIYTDTCQTKLLDLDSISNAYSISNPNSYKYPRFNQGYWSLNYFRNILNANNKFKYLGDPTNTNSKYDDGRQKAEYRSDENSLIEGKYFVARMYFNQHCDFKIDTISFNYKNKL